MRQELKALLLVISDHGDRVVDHVAHDDARSERGDGGDVVDRVGPVLGVKEHDPAAQGDEHGVVLRDDADRPPVLVVPPDELGLHRALEKVAPEEEHERGNDNGGLGLAALFDVHPHERRVGQLVRCLDVGGEGLKEGIDHD